MSGFKRHSFQMHKLFVKNTFSGSSNNQINKIWTRYYNYRYLLYQTHRFSFHSLFSDSQLICIYLFAVILKFIKCSGWDSAFWDTKNKARSNSTPTACGSIYFHLHFRLINTMLSFSWSFSLHYFIRFNYGAEHDKVFIWENVCVSKYFRFELNTLSWFCWAFNRDNISKMCKNRAFK